MSTEVTLKEASKILGLSERTVRRYAKIGKLLSKKINGRNGIEYRFSKETLDNYLRQIGKGNDRGQKSCPVDHVILPKDVYLQYQQAMVRLGQLENQRLMLTERAESLQQKEAEYQRIIEEKERIIQKLKTKLENLTRKKWWEFWKKPISQLLSEPSQL